MRPIRAFARRLATRWAVSPLTDRDDYRMYLVEPKCGTMSPQSLDGQDVAFGFITGFYPEETIAGRSFHWASSRARLELKNTTNLAQQTRAVASFETYVPGTHHITVRVAGSPPVTLPLHLGATTYTFERRLQAGARLPIDISTDGPRVPSGSDPRDLRVRVFDYSTQSVAGACSASSVKSAAR